jgi:hypothetical protein
MRSKTESAIAGLPDVIFYENIIKMTEQMEKCICKVKTGEGTGTGFFCKIPFPDRENMLPVFITNNHVLNRAELCNNSTKIKISIEKDSDNKIITNLDKRKKYTNDQNNYDITILEIKEEDNINNYLELDDKIINNIINGENKIEEFEDETIYIIQYPKGKLSTSFGRIKEINDLKKYEFRHKCSTDKGSSGSPILNLNNKVIGIHKNGGINGANFNEGTFLNYPIREFIKLFFNKNIIPKGQPNNNINPKDKIPNSVQKIFKNHGLPPFKKISINPRGSTTPRKQWNNNPDYKVKNYDIDKNPSKEKPIHTISKSFGGDVQEKDEIDISEIKYKNDIDELNDLYTNNFYNPMKFINHIIQKFPYKDYYKTKHISEKKNYEKIIEFIYPKYCPNNYRGKDNVGIYYEIHNILACIKEDLKMIKIEN